ncbi:MAG: ATP-dependent DNA helicase [Lachnospiraceae bacterium]|nr:ATP-dependent DNA helicase [Lachnospiraceae bacterium]
MTTQPGKKSILTAMQAGGRIHRKIQKSMGVDYQEEVSLQHIFRQGDYEVVLDGRADGIYPRKEVITIDEIKGTYKKLDKIEEADPVHLAQAKCYAYMYAFEQGLEKIGVQITYCNMDTEEIKRFYEEYAFEELEEWMEEIKTSFFVWSDFVYQARIVRDDTIKQVAFPYEYRKGQKKLTAAVYGAVKNKEIMFVQAPTGIGKTLSTIFPSVKSMEEQSIDKLFYLTAKTITRTAAEEAFSILRNEGLRFSTVTLTAKEKICFQEEVECNPTACPYAKGHYDRINEALYAILVNETVYTRQVISDYAEKYQVCPYELSLDVASFSDGIICDYNYVFDPKVALRRFFGEGKILDFYYLVDEAHNLVDRARTMYSATLYKEDFLAIRKILPEWAKKLKNACAACNKQMLAIKKEVDGEGTLTQTDSLVYSLLRFVSQADAYLEENQEQSEERKALLDLYFQVQHYLNMYDTMEDGYEIYARETDGRFMCKLFCIDPSDQLRDCFDYARAAILFSATFLPVNYYKELLIGDQKTKAIYVPSPFDPDKRKIMIANDVTSRYSRRNAFEYEKIFYYLDAMLDGKTGNYIVFFPSYEMMEQVFDICYERGMDIKCDLLRQTQRMGESEREDFLSEFSKTRKKSMLAFCVLGGIFSEGIDLVGEKLIGTAIVGTGLPGVSYEQNLLRDYFNRRGEDGFDYAYRFPGMNKVLQAAGRVIRTKEDEGVILLLDERFLNYEYRGLFPMEWEDRIWTNRQGAKEAMSSFWREKKE